YIYTSVPRSIDGAELTALQLETRIAEIDQQLQARGLADISESLLSAAEQEQDGWRLIPGRGLRRRQQRRRLNEEIRKLDRATQAHGVEMEQLLEDRLRLEREFGSLERTRKLLALWHAFHVPLSAGLFVLAIAHIGGAVYYATLTN